jgi:hypothetical protein
MSTTEPVQAAGVTCDASQDSITILAASSSPGGVVQQLDRQSAPSEDLLSALKALAEVAVVFTAVTFVGGWSYLASYYRSFGLNPLDLDAPPSVVSTIAIHMLYASVWPLIVAVIVLGSIHYLLSSRQASRTLAAAAVTCLLFVSALAGILRGRQLANEDMLETSGSLPSVGFITKSQNHEPSCLGYLAYDTIDCRLLLHSRNVYIFFKPIRVSTAGRPRQGNINLFMVPDSDVLGVHIRRGVQ